MPLQCKRPPPSDAPVRGGKKRMIGSHCAVPGCSNYAGKTRGMGVSYFKFPREPQLLGLWVKSIRRKGHWDPEKCHICSTHFKETDFERDLKSELLGLKKRNILKPGVVPSRSLPEYTAEEDDEGEEEEELGCQSRSSLNEDRRSILSSLPNDQVIEFDFGSSGESQDASAVCDEITNQPSDCEEMQEQPDEDEDLRREPPISTDPEEIGKARGGEDSLVSKCETKETIITFAGCEQSEHLKSEISRLQMELKAREDSMFVLEQSATLKAKQQMRIIKELTVENEQLKTKLKEKNEKISTLEEALATDTKLRSIFSPEELERFLKRAKKWAKM